MSQTPANWDTDAFAERIVREVIRRLLAMDAQQPGALRHSDAAAPLNVQHSISQKLITAATFESVPAGTTELLIPSRAVVTPLARDEAKAKGIRLTRGESPNPAQTRSPR